MYHIILLFQNVYEDVLLKALGEKRFGSLTRVADYWHFYKNLMTKMNQIGFILVKEHLKNALENLKSDLSLKFGDNPCHWVWGDIHQLTYKHFLVLMIY